MQKFAAESRWDLDRNRSREVTGKGGTRKEYHYTLLPPLVQGQIVTDAMVDEVGQKKEASREDLRAQSLWEALHRAPEKSRAEAEKRLEVLHQVELLVKSMSITAAVELVSIKNDIPGRTIHRWRKLTAGLGRTDWLPALVPAHTGRTKTAKCNQRAWDMLTSDYLRTAQPTFASCYDRMTEAARANGWGPIPSKVTLKRRLEREIGPAAIVMARKGQHAAFDLYPAQTRDRTHLHAMEGVNADGHVFNNFVEFEDGTIGRPCLIGFQDLYSGTILSHRISQTENKEVIRLAIADMIESWGIPDACVFRQRQGLHVEMAHGRYEIPLPLQGERGRAARGSDATGRRGAQCHPASRSGQAN
jgi:hypothetical protein